MGTTEMYQAKEKHWLEKFYLFLTQKAIRIGKEFR